MKMKIVVGGSQRRLAGQDLPAEQSDKLRFSRHGHGPDGQVHVPG